MFRRLLVFPKQQNAFLFGARGVGKSTLLKQFFKSEENLWIDLLDPVEERKFTLYPEELERIVLQLPPEIKYIIIDEIQKLPKLLDVIHRLIEKNIGKYFALTGSSARKLKYGGANLLAGRAFVYHLFPLSFLELPDSFNLVEILQWGLLPKIQFLKLDEEKRRFLMSYAQTYLKEEIWAEQFIRKLDPFRRFLEVSAQCNGKIINYANISRDVGVDDKTIRQYFSLLEDSLIGFFLEPFHHSFRKRLSLKPKFYFFDVGVTRCLANMLTIPIQANTSYYGEVFEHFIILECIKLVSYMNLEYRVYYLKTKDDLEVDLIVERPGQLPLFVEIKSSVMVTAEGLASFIQITKDFKECEAVCFSQDSYSKKIENVTVYPWAEGIKKFFVKKD